MLKILLDALPALPNLIHPTLWGGYDEKPHFTDAETKAVRSELTNLRPRPRSSF